MRASCPRQRVNVDSFSRFLRRARARARSTAGATGDGEAERRTGCERGSSGPRRRGEPASCPSTETTRGFAKTAESSLARRTRCSLPFRDSRGSTPGGATSTTSPSFGNRRERLPRYPTLGVARSSARVLRTRRSLRAIRGRRSESETLRAGCSCLRCVLVHDNVLRPHERSVKRAVT